jgi:hypothetical protein
MTRKPIAVLAAVALIVLGAERSGAQSAPPPPRIASGATAAGAPAPSPLLVPATAAVPAPPKTVVPASALPPKDSAVALCNNGTFVMQPGTPADCASRGGLRVAMPPRTKVPVRQAGPAAAAASARPAIAAQLAPANATMHCKDGTYLTGAPSTDRCANNGGVAAIFPPRPAAPTPPAQRPRP